MRNSYLPPPYGLELAELPIGEFVLKIDDAYAAGRREEFIDLSQRLVWGTMRRAFRCRRLTCHWQDMYSVGLISVIEQFDSMVGRPLDRVYGYFKRVAYTRVLQWLYRQGILINKRVKCSRMLLLCTDLSGNDADYPTIIDNVAARSEAPELSLEETIQLCLEAATSGTRTVRKQQFVRGVGMSLAFDPNETATPYELRARGYTWKAIGELLGVSLTAACNQPHKTPEQLRQQKVRAEQNRAIGRARAAGELIRESGVGENTIPRGPHIGTGAPLAFDPTITATPKELREQGHTWKAIGELLGISITAAHHAAHKSPSKTPAELRQQALVSRRLRAIAS